MHTTFQPRKLSYSSATATATATPTATPTATAAATATTAAAPTASAASTGSLTQAQAPRHGQLVATGASHTSWVSGDLVFLPVPGRPGLYIPRRVAAPDPARPPVPAFPPLALDLRGLDARAVARHFDALEAKPAVARAVRCVHLPDAHPRRRDDWMVQRLASLPALTQLHLRAPAAGTWVDLRKLAHPTGQVAVFLELSQGGSCAVHAPPGTALYARTPQAGPARAKHWLAAAVAGRPEGAHQTMPSLAYQRRGGASGARRQPADQPTARLAMARLVRQWLLDAMAGQLPRLAPHLSPSGAAGPAGARHLGGPLDPGRLQAAQQIGRALQALSHQDGRLEDLLGGLAGAWQAQTQLSPEDEPLAHARFDYSYVESAQARALHLGPVIDQAAAALLTLPPWQVTRPEHLGACLAPMWPQLRVGEARHLLIGGKDHLLALVLRRRSGEAASVVCYDPHRHINHVRVLLPSLSELARLDLGRLLVEPGSVARYFGTGERCVAGIYDLRQLLVPAPAPVGVSLPQPTDQEWGKAGEAQRAR